MARIGERQGDGEGGRGRRGGAGGQGHVPSLGAALLQLHVSERVF